MFSRAFSKALFFMAMLTYIVDFSILARTVMGANEPSIKTIH